MITTNRRYNRYFTVEFGPNVKHFFLRGKSPERTTYNGKHYNIVLLNNLKVGTF